MVDAIVTDKRNRPVINLKAEDFAVFENNVPQRITSVRLEQGAVQTVAPGTRGNQPASPASPSASRRAYTMLLLDYSTTEFPNEKLVRDASLKYVQERLRLSDRMAVLVLGTSLRPLTPFTADKEVLSAALRTPDLRGTAMVADRAALNAEIDRLYSIAHPEAGVDASTTVTPAPGQSVSSTDIAAASSAGSDRAERAAARRMLEAYSGMRSASDRDTTRAVLEAIKAIALGAQGIEGRKSLVIFSSGFVVDPVLQEQMKSAVSAANRANVAIYCIDSRGLEFKATTGEDELRKAARGDMDREETRTLNQTRARAAGGETIFDRTAVAGRDIQESALRFISNETGGSYIHNTNDLGTGLARVEQETHTYYVIDYRPANEKQDATYRAIRVEVKQPGVTVRSRSGYYAMPPGLETLPPSEAELIAQARSAPQSEQLFVRAAGFRLSESEYRVPVIVELPSSAIHFEKAAAGYTAQLRILGVATDATRPEAAAVRFGGPTMVTLSEAQYQAVGAGGVSLVNPVRLPPGNYELQVVARDAGGNKTLWREQALYLRPIAKELAVSTVLLANQYDKAVPGAASQDGFLISQGIRMMPSAQCRFRKGDNLLFYFDVYNPAIRAETNKTDLVVSVRLMKDGKAISGPQYKLAEAVEAKAPRLTVMRYINLSTVPEGDYSLVVEVKDQVADKVERAQAPFSIVAN